MAGGLRQGDGFRADEPESSKDMSSPSADDHDGECCNHPHIRPALFRLDGRTLPGSCKLALLAKELCRLQSPRPRPRPCPANKG